MSVLIDQYMIELEDSKQNIKQAIMDKGGTITGGLSSYAESISNLEIGGSISVLGEVTKTITDNGETTYNAVDDNLDGYSSITVNVEVPIPTYTSQSKEVTIKENGSQTITPDEGYDGLSEVEITVNVASSGGTGKPKIPNGFQFISGDIALVDFSQYDWSDVYDTSNFFSGCTHSTGDWSNFEQNFNGRLLSGKDMFIRDGDTRSSFTSFPNMDTSEMIDMSGLFKGCSNLTTSPILDTSNAIDMSMMFYSCSNLSSIPQLDTTNVLDMTQMFRGCEAIQTAENLDMSNVIVTEYMFENCYGLKSVNLPDTQNVRDMSYMFNNCIGLQTVENLDMSNVINAEYMFQYCKGLVSIPQLNTSKLGNSRSMFRNCTKLQVIPQLDLSGVIHCDDMFSGCAALTSMPDLNLSSCYQIPYLLNSCSALETIGVIHCDSVTNVNNFPSTYALNNVKNFGGFRNLGKLSSLSNTTTTSGFMSVLPNLTYESVINVLNELYDRASAGLSVITLKLHANHMAMLSDEDKAIATNKGWTLT